MSITHREALPGGRRLRLGIGGPSRSGKTYSSLRVATGIAAGLNGKIFVIDCDNEFSLDYADEFKFQIVDLQPPFTPERYQEAVEYCVAQGAAVIVVDHMSHEQTGPGGILERQQEVEGKLAEKWKTTREKAKAASWNEAKTIPHGKFVSYVTRVKQPMIFNFRCKDKVKIVKGDNGKQEWVHMGYTPICAEQFDYEMTAMVILPPNSDGVPDKDLSEIRKPLRKIMHLEDQLDESLGQRLAAWAAGDATPKSDAITAEQATEIRKKLGEKRIAIAEFTRIAKTESVEQLPAEAFARAIKWIDRQPAPTIADEAVALRQIDTAADEGAASAVLDLCKSQPFYPRAVEAYKARFNAPGAQA